MSRRFCRHQPRKQLTSSACPKLPPFTTCTQVRNAGVCSTHFPITIYVSRALQAATATPLAKPNRPSNSSRPAPSIHNYRILPASSTPTRSSAPTRSAPSPSTTPTFPRRPLPSRPYTPYLPLPSLPLPSRPRSALPSQPPPRIQHHCNVTHCEVLRIRPARAPLAPRPSAAASRGRRQVNAPRTCHRQLVHLLRHTWRDETNKGEKEGR